MKQRRGSFEDWEWAEIVERAGDEYKTLPESQQNESNVFRIVLGYPPLIKGGDRVSEKARKKRKAQ